MFLIGDLKDCVKLNIKDDLGSCLGTYSESLIKIDMIWQIKDKPGT